MATFDLDGRYWLAIDLTAHSLLNLQVDDLEERNRSPRLRLTNIRDEFAAVLKEVDEAVNSAPDVSHRFAHDALELGSQIQPASALSPCGSSNAVPPSNRRVARWPSRTGKIVDQ